MVASRQGWMKTLIVCWGAAVAAGVPKAWAQNAVGPGGGTATANSGAAGNSGGVDAVEDLKTQLEKGLRARRPDEFDFIGKVVRMVEQDRLPKDLVQSTFLWARKKPDGRRVVYFEYALRRRAEDRGIAGL